MHRWICYLSLLLAMSVFAAEESPLLARVVDSSTDRIPRHTVAPQYPRTARRRGVEGAVGLRVVVEADGSIGSIEIVTSSGSATLDRAAVAAVEDWEFRPAEVRGRPVRSTLDLPMIRFELTD